MDLKRFHLSPSSCGLLAALFLFFTQSLAQAITVSELQKKMAESDAGLQSVRFDYVQEMKSGLTDEVQTSSGTAYFKKPKNLRIEQKEPMPQLVVSSGKSVFIYTPRFKQVLKDSWNHYFAKGSFFPGLIGFQQTLEKLKSDYRWSLGASSEMNGEKMFRLNLENKSPQDKDQLNLWIAESDFIPRKAEVIAGTLKVTTTLVSLQKNPVLDAELFKFEKPQESQIIQVP